VISESLVSMFMLLILYFTSY